MVGFVILIGFGVKKLSSSEESVHKACAEGAVSDCKEVGSPGVSTFYKFNQGPENSRTHP